MLMDGNTGLKAPSNDPENVERRMFNAPTSASGNEGFVISDQPDEDKVDEEEDEGDAGSTQAICLRGWKGARVLARLPNQETFCSGCLKTIRRNGRDIGVQFDGVQDGTLTFYNDVLESKRLDVIGDQIPAPSEVSSTSDSVPASRLTSSSFLQVKIGDIVCARRNGDQPTFDYAEVVGLSMRPVSFQVKFDRPANMAGGRTQRSSSGAMDEEIVWVSRANVRLLRAPW